MEFSEVAPSVVETATPTNQGIEVYSFGKDEAKISFVRFGAANPKRIFACMPGWPWRADAKITWGLPVALSKDPDAASLNITTRAEKDDTGGLALQGDGTRQLLLAQGVNKETGVVMVAHSAGALRAAYTAKSFEDHNSGVPVTIVIANPMGFESKSAVQMMKDFLSDGTSVGPKERQRAGVRAGDKDPIFSQLKSTRIILLTTEKDTVSNHKSYLPEGEIRAYMQPLTGNEKLQQLSMAKWEDQRRRLTTGSKDWESLTEQEKQGRIEEFDKQFGSQEAFATKYAKVYAKQEEMVRFARARDQIAREKYFQSAQNVRTINITRQADHNGAVAVRSEQIANVIQIPSRLSRFF